MGFIMLFCIVEFKLNKAKSNTRETRFILLCLCEKEGSKEGRKKKDVSTRTPELIKRCYHDQIKSNSHFHRTKFIWFEVFFS